MGEVRLSVSETSPAKSSNPAIGFGQFHVLRGKNSPRQSVLVEPTGSLRNKNRLLRRQRAEPVMVNDFENLPLRPRPAPLLRQFVVIHQNQFALNRF